MDDDRSETGAARWSNLAEAASPQAIASPLPPRPPIFDNDPTRGITRRERLLRAAAVLAAVVALVALIVVTVLVLAHRS